MSEANEAPAVMQTVTPVTNIIQETTMPQVTSVSQLSDVQPTDWAFQALQSLVERYSCIAGYPNGTYRGNRAMTRYEFAAGLNACLQKINELIATSTDNLVRKEDLERLRKLQGEFSRELAALHGRVDAVEAKASELAANQFSTTTKLQGQVVAVLSDVLSGNRVDGARPQSDNNATFASRVRLEFVSSFSGKDTLFTRIQSNNIVNPESGTPEGNFFFASTDGTTNAFIDALWYSFPLSENTEVKLLANNSAGDDITSTVNLFDGDGSFGALSSFGSRNPIYLQVNGAGGTINHNFGKNLTLSLGYLAGSAYDPTPKNGLGDGSYAALAQLTIKPSDRMTLGLTYINAYKQPFGTGSNAAIQNVASVLDDTTILADDAPFVTNSYGVEASIQIAENIVLGGWMGYSNTRNLVATNAFPDRGQADIWNWAVTLGLPDLGGKGNLAGFIFGMEPKVTASSIDGLTEDKDTSYHIEAFYQHKLTDNITVTPGVIWLTAPNHNQDNDDVVIGALRTTFSF